MKIFITVIVTLLAGVGLVYLLGGRLACRGSVDRDAPSVRLEIVGRGDLVEIVSAPGLVQARTKVSISAKVSARIVELPFAEGQNVTKGNPTSQPAVPASVLVRLDSKDLEAQLRAAEAHRAGQAAQITVSEARVRAQESQVEASRVMLADAQRDLKRQKDLLASKDVGTAVVDQAQAKADQLQAQLNAATRELEANAAGISVLRHELDVADAEIARARDNLSYTTIASPIDGVVTRLNAQVGEMVITGTMNNPGTVIMEVADLSQMLVNARVDEGTVASVEPGQKAIIRAQAYAGQTFEGVVQSVALSATEEKDGSKYYKAEVLLKADGRRVLSGLTADVDIETRRHTGVLKVPSQAVLGRPLDELPADLRDRPEVDKAKAFVAVVYRFVNGKAVVTPVSVGASDVTHTIIRSGLSDSDRIIAGPYKVLESLKHDQTVKAEGATTQPATKSAQASGGR